MPRLGPGRVNAALYAFSGECEAKNGMSSDPVFITTILLNLPVITGGESPFLRGENGV